MSGEQLVQRMLASEGLINSQHLRTGQLDEDEWPKLVAASGSLATANIYIDDTPGIKMSEIRAQSRRLAKEKGNLGLIVIDYLQLIEGPHSESRQQEVSAISRQLKKLAKELHYHGQLSRDRIRDQFCPIFVSQVQLSRMPILFPFFIVMIITAMKKRAKKIKRYQLKMITVKWKLSLKRTVLVAEEL